MIKYIENFDHADESFLTTLGWVSTFNPAWDIEPSGRAGSNALLVPAGYCWAPAISRKCNVIAFGICMGGLLVDRAPSGGYYRWDTAYYSYSGPVFDFDFFYGTGQHNFRVRLAINKDIHQGTVTCYTGLDGTGYPAISTPEKIPFPQFSDEYQFVEVYLDVTDFMNGRVKVAINGRTYVDKSGIATAAYNTFGSDPYDDRAKIDRVRLTFSRASLIDSFYLLDDQAGYQDDFLGPVSVYPCYPVADGTVNDWMAVENSEVIDAPGQHHDFIDDAVLVAGDENTYLQADQDMLREMFSFEENPVPAGCDLLAVNARTFARNVGAPGFPKMNAIIPLFQIQGNPVVETNSLAVRRDGYAYFPLDVYYPLVPGFAIPWVEYLLEQSQFGFLIRTPESVQVAAEEISWDELLSTLYDWDELFPENLGVLDEVSDNSADLAIWDVLVEDGFDVTEEPDYGEFLLEDGFNCGDTMAGSCIGTRDIGQIGTPFAESVQGGGYEPDHVFDGLNNTSWRCTWETTWWPTWVGIDMGGDYQAPNEYRLIINGGSTTEPKKWDFQGLSRDDVWVTLDSRENFVHTEQQVVQYVFPLYWNPNEAYSQFRIYITESYYPYCVELCGMKILVPFSEEFS